MRSAITERLYQSNRQNAWFKGSSTHGYADNNSNTDSTARHMNGGLFGIDRITESNEAWATGIFAGYGNTRFNTRGSRADIDTLHLGGYAGRSFGDMKLNLGTGYAYHQINTSRGLAFGNFSGRESADYNAQTLQVFADIGYRIPSGQGSLEPFFTIAQVYAIREGFKEHGDVAALKVNSEQSHVTLGIVGLRFDQPLNFSYLPLNFNGSFGLRHAEGDVAPKSQVRLNGGSDFDIKGNPIATNALVYDIALNSKLTSTVNAGIRWRAQQRGRTHIHAANAYVAWVLAYLSGNYRWH